MTIQLRTQARLLLLTLFSALTWVHPWAAAAEAPAATVLEPAHCADAAADCVGSAARNDSPLRPVTQGDCTRGAQDCDTRSKAMRTRADHESRDRHACRD